MSVILNAVGKYLKATLADAPVEGDTKLLTMWVKWDGSQSHGSRNYFGYLRDSSGNCFASMRISNVPNMLPEGSNGGTTVGPGGMAHTTDVWWLYGVRVSPNGSGANVQGYRRTVEGGMSSTTAGGITTSTNTGRVLDDLVIGTAPTDLSQRFRGRIADVAVWRPDNTAHAEAIFAELAESKTADSISSGTPLWYAPLLGGSAATIGANPFEGGELTFDEEDHPALAGGTVTKGVITPPLYNGATLRASVTGITAVWWDDDDPSTFDAPAYQTIAASTNALGALTLDLDASTGLAVGQSGFLLLFKTGATVEDHIYFAGPLAVQAI